MEDVPGFRRALLGWYAAHRRDLPWRRTRDPYAILVAEVLLQQTRVGAGAAYYRRFLRRFPSVKALARADEEDVLRAWEGLGYYRRARHLHRAARRIVEAHGGRIPDDMDALLALPGVGAYTAGAVASIAFGTPVPAVDGNVVRVLARLFRVEEDVATASTKRLLRRHAETLLPEEDPGTFNQALMELGSLVCLPRTPRCPACPVAEWCLGRAAGREASLPRRRKRGAVPEVDVVFAVVERGDRILLVRRDDGLLGGLWSLPGGEIASGETAEDAVRRLVRETCNVRIEPGPLVGRRVHAFSHRRWRAVALRCRPLAAGPVPRNARWVPRATASTLPLVPFHRAFLERSATEPEAGPS
jgi:A/G-specific adenine glycosylase